jgi:hypothetical protein
MKKNPITNNFRLFFFAFLLLGINVVVTAQPGDPGGGDDVPITGIEWLLIGGAAFGARKTYTNFKNRRPEV